MSEVREPYVADRTDWGAGPWDGEPDRVDFIHAGFSCFLHRGPLGQWCGYVGVPREHPAFEQPYDHVDVPVHGGLTYANRCSGHLCHVPQPGMPDEVWWLGFDCAHCGDFTPSSNKYWGNGYPWPTHKYDHAHAVAADTWQVERYCTVDWVRAETERLADQLAAMQPEASR